MSWCWSIPVELFCKHIWGWNQFCIWNSFQNPYQSWAGECPICWTNLDLAFTASYVHPVISGGQVTSSPTSQRTPEGCASWCEVWWLVWERSFEVEVRWVAETKASACTDRQRSKIEKGIWPWTERRNEGKQIKNIKLAKKKKIFLIETHGQWKGNSKNVNECAKKEEGCLVLGSKLAPVMNDV